MANKKTSDNVASKASNVLKDKKFSNDDKYVAGSALS